MNQERNQTRLIALDWGTSSLRAYRLGADARVLESRSLPWGVMHLPEVAPAENFGAGNSAGFELAFEQACGDWLRVSPCAPVIAAGMVGSRIGWHETPYLPIPITVSQIGSTLGTVRARTGQIVHIVPGLIQNSALPNVMRGEETQVVGALNILELDKNPSRAENQNEHGEILIGLPGTHSKWVHILRQHRETQSYIEHFDTFMTGEVFAALCEHTILGSSMQAGGDSEAEQRAFERGSLVAQTAAGQAGVLSTIFSARTLGLTGVLNGAAQREYLSGLLIGHEIAALKAMLRDQERQPSQVMLVGEAGLCKRYAQVLRAYDFGKAEVVDQATQLGLWQLALAAGLLKPA